MKQNQKDEKPKLNDPLCPEEFELCVPKTSKLLVPKGWSDSKDWKDYVRTLTPEGKLPPEYDEEEEGKKKAPPCCWSCECRAGWVLCGELAIAHACRVHDRIHRQVLRFENVSAVDVGFAILERETKFGEFLAIRVHVNQKLPPEMLVNVGLADLASAAFVLGRPERGDEEADCASEECDKCQKELLYKILEPWRQEETEKGPGSGMRYPIGGVRPEDLSVFCPEKLTNNSTIDDIRLCICGVPIDIVNAQYNPSVAHPGGDAPSGVFAEPPQRSNELSDEEQILIGRGRVSPLVGGVSVGSISGQAGTLGAVVWDRTDGTPCVLGNWHVLAGNTTAQVGQSAYQPALFDGGTEADEVARLKRWYLGEAGDAAIAELSGDRHFASGEILGLWHPISGYLRPKLNMEVRKWGRSTGFTQGFVDGIHLATNINYGNGVVRYFRDQFHIAPLYRGEDVSQVGDSGSVVVTCFKPEDLEEDLAKVKEDLVRLCKKLEESDGGSDAKHVYKAVKEACEESKCKDPAAWFGCVEAKLAGQNVSSGRSEKNSNNDKTLPEDYLEHLKELGYDPKEAGDWFLQILMSKLHNEETLEDILEHTAEYIARQRKKKYSEITRVYYAVGMIFAGDTPGSPFGEFAVASDISNLAEELRFSLRPVFEPRSSFRELRVRPRREGRLGRVARSQRSLTPGDQGGDPSGQGPQPDPKTQGP